MSYQDMLGCTFETENRGGNFEFRFTGPESIPNAVKRYNALRGAELAQLKRQREMGRSHVPSMPRFCKVRRPGQDVTSMVTSRDLDVVTQLSLDSEPISNGDNDDGGEDEDNDGGKHEIHSPLPSMRISGGAESPKRVKNKSRGRKKTHTGIRKVRYRDPVQNGLTFERLEELHREVCAELETFGEAKSLPSAKATPRPLGPKNLAKQRRNWVKRRQETQKKPQEAEDFPKSQDQEGQGDSSLADAGQVSFEDYHTPQAKWVDIVPSAMMSQAMQVNVCQAQNATPLAAYQFMEQHGSLEPEPLAPFFLEDSDLEYEYADRQGYLRYVEARPNYTSSDSDNPDQMAQRNPIWPNVGPPCFVELERRPDRVSLLRSLSPMRYTSQRSEETLRTHSPGEEQDYMIEEIEVPPLELRKAANSRKASGRKPVVSGQRASKSRRTNANANAMAKGGQRNPPSPRARRPARQGGGDEAAPPNPTKVPSTTNNAPVTSPERANKRRKPKAMVVYSKSLEDLKFEKLGIYNKITLTQERIISALDKLQTSLLQLQVPNCSAQERQKRQRNAFEFCVRFSRNFLYPLKGMIDDVRLTTVASFNSATSNEACQRVVCVYGLMQQSIQTYQRQLRYFLLEKVPQKLSALIEMIYTMTNCCLDKGMLDRHDPVVECLQERCTRFLSFIEDMQEERFKLAREAMRRLHKHQGHQGHQGHQSTGGSHSHRRKKKSVKAVKSVKSPKAPTQPRQEKLRSHERYDLKMCLNDLKLYEPRLVPKERQQAEKRNHRVRRPRTSVNPNATATSAVIAGATGALGELPSDLEMQSVAGNEVQTQMQLAGDGGTTSSLSTMPTLGPMGQWPNQGNGESESREEQLHRAMLDALQLVSRSQVQQVLDPLMRSLGVYLGEKLPQNQKQ
uniref:Uncharacterized protein LOC108039464 n=1 Tax=Drosophila rhopaloa TaxID=1041015 RepID=A0A6P4E1X0_DRORH